MMNASGRLILTVALTCLCFASVVPSPTAAQEAIRLGPAQKDPDPVAPNPADSDPVAPNPADSDAANPFRDDGAAPDDKEGVVKDGEAGSTEPVSPRFTPRQPDSLAAPGWPTPTITRITPGTLDRLHSPILRNDLQINGAQSCAISNCHAGPRPGVAQPWAYRGSAYQLWIENDPHAQSWRTICGEESIAMMRRLKIIEGDQIVDQAGFDNCLACHNSTKRYDEPRTRTTHQLSARSDLAESIATICRERSTNVDPSDVNQFHREGVGCSGCHGPSEQWIYTHFEQNWSPSGATAEGFVEAGDLFVRARMCASCHVGDKDRDMNHDIIAAGHPALRYELATFHAWQPKHWRDEEAADRTYYEAQLWLAGQVAATDASLSLIQTRASDAHTVSEWPEFSSYDCASCHHNLGLDNARKPITDSRKAVAMYSQWNDAGLRWLIDLRTETGVASVEDFELLESLDRVKTAMESKAKPDASAVASAASDARMSLARWLDGTPGMQERYQFRSDRLASLVASAAGKRKTFQTWESSVQFYLAAVAARESWPGGWDGTPRKGADALRLGLRYPEMIDVSRFAKRSRNSGPTLNRADAMRLGIELAGWLGPVSPELMFAEDAEDDETITQKLRDELEAMIERINARWEIENEADRKAAQKQAAEEAEKKRIEDAKKGPPEKEMSDQELREQLRKRLEAAESDGGDAGFDFDADN